jgi:hypothetical protein
MGKIHENEILNHFEPFWNILNYFLFLGSLGSPKSPAGCRSYQRGPGNTLTSHELWGLCWVQTTASEKSSGKTLRSYREFKIIPGILIVGT